MTINDHVESNNRRTIFLLFLFPIVIGILVFLISFFLHSYLASDPRYVEIPDWWERTAEIIIIVIATNIIWTLISYRFSKKYTLNGLNNLISVTAHSSYVDLYRIVENISIVAGIKTPTVYIMDVDEMNAFAAGTDPDDSVLVFTRGIVKKLLKAELEGVVAHEIGI